MLDALFYYGLRLFHYRNYVGSILHMYNVLRQFTGIVAIPLLDQLCVTFDHVLFPGGRPNRNFKACYMRYLGGRLRFHSSTSAHKSGCHSFIIPPHAARAAAGFGTHKEANKDPKFDYRRLSLLVHMKEKGYHLDLNTWNRVHETNLDGADQDTRSHCHHHHIKHDSSSCSTYYRLQSLRKAIIKADSSGPFPVAKIKLFDVYRCCARIVSVISDKFHGKDSRPGQYCLCSVDALLTAADRCQQNEHKLQPLGCKQLVEVCQDALVEILGGKVLGQYLWEHV